VNSRKGTQRKEQSRVPLAVMYLNYWGNQLEKEVAVEAGGVEEKKKRSNRR